MSPYRLLAGRVVTVCALAFWLGGLTFYALVVVPAGTRVLGGAVAQGFVTRAVTERLNLVGVGALAVLAWSAFAAPRGRRAALVGTWSAMVAAQVAIFALHPRLAAMLDVASRVVVEPPRFYAMHRVYLLVTGAQWLAGLAHLALTLAAWRTHDGGG